MKMQFDAIIIRSHQNVENWCITASPCTFVFGLPDLSPPASASG